MLAPGVRARSCRCRSIRSCAGSRKRCTLPPTPTTAPSSTSSASARPMCARRRACRCRAAPCCSRRRIATPRPQAPRLGSEAPPRRPRRPPQARHHGPCRAHHARDWLRGAHGGPSVDREGDGLAQRHVARRREPERPRDEHLHHRARRARPGRRALHNSSHVRGDIAAAEQHHCATQCREAASEFRCAEAVDKASSLSQDAPLALSRFSVRPSLSKDRLRPRQRGTLQSRQALMRSGLRTPLRERETSAQVVLMVGHLP